MPTCYKCGQVLTLGTTVGFKEACSKCDTDLHACRNCKFYDLNSYNNCRESQADRIVDKEKANFCDYFKIADASALTSKSEVEAKTKNKLDDLFK